MTALKEKALWVVFGSATALVLPQPEPWGVSASKMVRSPELEHRVESCDQRAVTMNDADSGSGKEVANVCNYLSI